MKIILSMSTLLLIAFISGCTDKIDAVPVYVESIDKKNSCFDSDESSTCTKEFKTISYVNNCSKGCEFPVSIRKVSTCKYGGGM